MNTHTNNEHQIVMSNGLPVAVVVPYDDYLCMASRRDEDIILPHAVVGMTLKGHTLLRAWREYLGLTQADIAERMGITQPAYAQMEAPDASPRPATLRRVADAMGIDWEQLRHD